MNAQNIYDDPDFLARYATLGRQVHGLDGAAEWPVLRSLLPDLAGRRIVDLGCGFGWFSRWAHEYQAATVLAIDVSTRMFGRARAETSAASVEYRCVDLDQLDLDPGSADVVFSSLTFHYVHDLERLLSMAAASLAPGGSILFSVEHPIYSAPTPDSPRSLLMTRLRRTACPSMSLSLAAFSLGLSMASSLLGRPTGLTRPWLSSRSAPSRVCARSSSPSRGRRCPDGRQR